MLINRDDFDLSFRGYLINACAVRNKQVFQLSARNEEHIQMGLSEGEIEKRVIRLFLDGPLGNRTGFQGLIGYNTLHACCARDEDRFVATDTNGQVYRSGNGESNFEKPIPECWQENKGPPRVAIFRAKRVLDKVLVCGGGGNAAWRIGANSWLFFGADLPNPLEIEDPAKMVQALKNDSFDDIDAFAPKDIYTVGGHGRVWHYNGAAWRQCAFPSNMRLYSVCCGGDGFVYIGAQSGTVYKGRGDKWTLVHRGYSSLPFKDMVWHAGRLWCTSDYGLWSLQDDRIERVLASDEVLASAGNLAVGDGVMLLAGQSGVSFHDGEMWFNVFNYVDFA